MVIRWDSPERDIPHSEQCEEIGRGAAWTARYHDQTCRARQMHWCITERARRWVGNESGIERAGDRGRERESVCVANESAIEGSR
jgi:hypothetical protein